MAITNSTVFDKVVLPPVHGSLNNILIFNGNTYVGDILPGFETNSFDSSTDEFQIVMAAIRNGTAVESYRFGDGITYTDADLPSWLSWAKDQNPFHVASQQVSIDSVTYYPIRFKSVPSHPDDEVVTYPNPNVNYPTAAALNIGLVADGWYKEKALAEASGDSSTNIVIAMTTTETTSPIVGANGQITGYGFQVVINDIDSDALRYSDDDGVTWTHTKPANPTHYAKILPDGSWVEHQYNPPTVTVAASGALHVDKGGVWTSYQTHVSRGWDISDIAQSDIHRFELRATFLDGWTDRQIIIDQNILFSPSNIPLITPYEYRTGSSNYEVWYAHISKQDGHIQQGLSRTSGVHDSVEYNRITFAKVSFPEFTVRINDGNLFGRQYIPISSADGIDIGDTIYFTAADGTKEQCRFVALTFPTLDQGDGTYADIIEVERGINGTSMMTQAQEDTAAGTGVIDRSGVARYIQFKSAAGNEYPAVIRLNVVKR